MRLRIQFLPEVNYGKLLIQPAVSAQLAVSRLPATCLYLCTVLFFIALHLEILLSGTNATLAAKGFLASFNHGKVICFHNVMPSADQNQTQ